MKPLFSRNPLLSGIATGILLFAVSFALLGFVKSQLDTVPHWMASARSTALLALIPNVLLMRFFFINRKAERAGQGMLAVSFVIMLAIFILLQ